MANRADLNAFLKTVCDRVYYQPGKNVKMQYPCVVYADSTAEQFKANNNVYLLYKGYQVTIISQEPDSPIPKSILLGWGMSEYSNAFISDNLYHTVLTVYTTF